MPTFHKPFRHVRRVVQTVMMLAIQVMHGIRSRLCARMALAAETLFLQKQLALYEARLAPSRRAMHATRLILVWLSYWFDWQPALMIVRPETFKRWRRQGWRLLWKTPAQPPGRPPIPPELQALIRRMARENLTWGQRRIANELLLKLGLRVSPRTVRKYMPRDGVGSPGQRCPSQRWSTFIRNHAHGLIASGLWADRTHSVQAWSGRLRRLVLWSRNRPPASELHGSASTDTVFLSLLHETVSVPPAWLPDTGEMIRVDERSPPACKPPCTPDRSIAVRAASADALDVPPAMAATCRWNRASPPIRHTGPLGQGRSRSMPWRHAA